MANMFSQLAKPAPLGIAAAIALGLAGRAAADDTPTADQIVEKSYCVGFHQGADNSAEVSMVIVDGQGRTQERELIMLRRDETPDKCGDQRYYAYFKRPADVQKMRFLVWREKGKDDSRWLYLPALDLVKRISSADKRTSFAGTHFFYEDVSGRSIAADYHKLVSITDNYYVIENTPKKPKDVEFKYYRSFIHKKTFLTVKTEFYDHKGSVYRTSEVKKVETIDGFPTATNVIMTDDKIGGHSEAKIRNVKYNTGIPKDIFTERFLRQIPTEYVN